MSFETTNYDLGDEAMPRAKGLKRDPEEFKKLKEGQPAFKLFTDAVVPGKVDLRGKISPCENQGSCGSCWDFSIIKALRSAHMLAGKDPGRLSFNYLLNNCGPGPRMWGCNGGDFPAGLSCLNGAGPWLYEEDPYYQRETSCKTQLKVAATAEQWVLVGSHNRKPTFQELAGALANGHMLSVDVDASSGSWSNYRSGIYNVNAGSSIDHMVNLVGYDMETSVDAQGNALFNAQGMPVNGDGYLIIQNNWGENWGEGGYMRTRWGCNAIAETAMFFVVKAPTPPPPEPPKPPVPPIPPAPSPEAHLPVWAWVALGIGVSGLVAGALVLGLEIGKRVKN